MIDKTVLVYDNGQHVELAVRLSKEFERTCYFKPLSGAFPRSAEALIGSGFENVERVTDFWSMFKEVDTFVFPDLYTGDLQTYLREEGKAVFGSGNAQELELDRFKFRELQKKLGMSVPESRTIVGLEKLISIMKEEENLFIKINRYRGDMETFHHVTFKLSKNWIDELSFFLGPRQFTIEFLVEEGVLGVEVGLDVILSQGKLPHIASYGYEIKDAGFVGRVCEYSKTPEGLQTSLEVLLPHLEEVQGFLSTECRVTEEGDYYLIDPCLRAPSPPSEAYQCVYKNLGEVVQGTAEGDLVALEASAEYFALIVLTSEWVEKGWLAVDVPAKMRDRVKLRQCCVVEGQTYCSPLGFSTFGFAVGLGDSPEEAIEDCKKIASEIEAYQFDAPLDALAEASEVIKEGKKFGIDF